MDTEDKIEKNVKLDTPVQQSTKKRKQKEVAIFGNYRNYYGYRIDQDMEEDPRIKVLKKEWFEGKNCLDIGCNSGLITITIAKKFCCQSILGVDIDSARIEDAYWNLRKIVKMSSLKVPPKTSDATESLSEGITDISEGLPSSILFDKVTFRKENFVQSRHSAEDKSYDTILCLSVTKWIHLNWGDDGLIILFSKIWRLLLPGGIFILEPQPWHSYFKNRQVSEIAKSNYHNIKLHPDGFQEILLDKIGFRMVEDLTSRLSGSKSGFDRPILAFWK